MDPIHCMASAGYDQLGMRRVEQTTRFPWQTYSAVCLRVNSVSPSHTSQGGLIHAAVRLAVRVHGYTHTCITQGKDAQHTHTNDSRDSMIIKKDTSSSHARLTRTPHATKTRRPRSMRSSRHTHDLKPALKPSNKTSDPFFLDQHTLLCTHVSHACMHACMKMVRDNRDISYTWKHQLLRFLFGFLPKVAWQHTPRKH